LEKRKKIKLDLFRTDHQGFFEKEYERERIIKSLSRCQKKKPFKI